MLVAALPLSLASCAEEIEYTPGEIPDGAQVFFPADTQTDYTISDDVSSITIPVKRVVTDDALSVNILTDIDETAQSLFNIPSTVSFEAGSADASLEITFSRADLSDGENYEIGLLINDEENTTPYGASELNITITPWAWDLLGTGTYRDDWLTGMWNAPAGTEIPVQIYEHKTNKGIYMVENMFGWDFMEAFFGGSEAAIIEAGYVLSYEPTNITIDCTNPAEVVIPLQPTGIFDGSSNDLGNLHIAALEYGTLENGVITFPVNGLFLGDADMYGLQCNSSGMFRVVLPGYDVKDYSLIAEYAGMRVDALNENASAIIEFTYGADVTGIDYAVVSGNVSSSASEYISGIADGTLENIYSVDGFVSGGESVSVEVGLTSGTYTIVALPKDDAGVCSADNAAVQVIYFPGVGGGSTPECNIEANLYKVSEYPDAAEYVSRYPDYSSALFEFTGSEIKSVKYYMNTTDVVNSIESMGLTYEDVVAQYGSDLSENLLAELNAVGKTWNIFINLTPSTSYTLLALAENDYGKTAVVKSEPFVTEAVPYSGELKVGQYYMSCQPGGVGDSYENVFEVHPTENSDTEFMVSNLGVNDGTRWYATYNPDASTFTVSGVEEGNEDFGNQFGGPFYYYDAEETMYYGFYSYASEDSKGNDPCVFTVDPDSKTLSVLNNDFYVAVQDAQTLKALGFIGYFTKGTAVTPYEASSSSVPSKVAPLSVAQFSRVIPKVPYRYSGNDPLSVDYRMLTRDMPAVSGPRTLSVSTGVCEPLPERPVTVRTVTKVPFRTVR